MPLGPACPKPPDAPNEGVRDYEPIRFPQKVEKSCNLQEETMRIKCHSFLSIYIKQTSYGRKFANEKKLCDGQKPDDVKGVIDETNFCERPMGEDFVSQCQGGDYCVIPVTGDMDSNWPKTFDLSCALLRKELRVEYICGEKLSPPHLIISFQLNVPTGPPM